MEPQKESSKSTLTEFIYACHFLWGKFILQTAGSKRLKTGQLLLFGIINSLSGSHRAEANPAMLLVQKGT